MMVAIGESVSYLASSDDGEEGENEDAEEEEQGWLSKDDEPGWVMSTILETTQQRMERFPHPEMKVDELT